MRLPLRGVDKESVGPKGTQENYFGHKVKYSTSTAQASPACSTPPSATPSCLCNSCPHVHSYCNFNLIFALHLLAVWRERLATVCFVKLMRSISFIILLYPLASSSEGEREK
eukprot:scaffold1481_cov137-Cylindrotheca_fusiformis.AAC.6